MSEAGAALAGDRPKGEPTAEWQLTFALEQNKYANEYIKFADQKAAIILGLITAGLAILESSGGHKAWTGQPFSLVGVLTTLAFLINVLAGAFAALTLLPRLRTGGSLQTTRIYWRDVAKLETPEKYAAAIMGSQREEIVRELLCHYQILSQICSRKYVMVTCAMWAGLVGIAVSLGVALLVK
jgi:hypothetical protein